MNRIINLPFLFIASVILFACEEKVPPVNNDQPGTVEPEGLPVPPEQGNSADQFYIDFFSTLEDDEPFFDKREVDIATQYILEQPGKKSLVYMFDRADFVVGTSYPLNEMSYDNAIFQFFAQSQPTTATQIEGTGIATRYIISKYDGIAQNGTYMSGCTVSAPLTPPTRICIYTTSIESMDNIKEIYSARSVALLGDAVIVGTVSNRIKADVVEYIEENMSLRAVTYGSDDTAMDLLVVVPASYVCRDIESGQKTNLPYYRVLIEKWL